MASGIKRGANRPKVSKHLRNATKKKFRNENPEALAAYTAKIARRRARKLKKKGRK